MMDDVLARRASRWLLGNQHKLDVVSAIADLIDEGVDDFFSRQVSKRVTEAADNQVADIIRQLYTGGLLVPVEDKADQLRNRYRARESSYWSMCRALREELRTASWEPVPGG